MLSRKQLRDLMECDINKDCEGCSCDCTCINADNEAAQTAIALHDMLKETTEALDDAVKRMRRYNLDTYIEKSHVVVKAQALLKDLEVEG